MSMLECQSPSLMVWPLINSMATGFLTVSDEEAGEAVRLLDWGASGDARLRVGESGAAGLAGLIRAAGMRIEQSLRSTGPRKSCSSRQKAPPISLFGVEAVSKRRSVHIPAMRRRG